MEIEDIRRLDVHPGETLVVRMPRSISAEGADRVSRAVRANLPEGVRVLVTTDDIGLLVVSDGMVQH